MDSKTLIELFGYLGSILVVVSMLMTSVMKLRIINTIGSVIFAIYALIIKSYPTAFMNFCLVAINIFHMVKLTRVETEYTLTESGVNDRFLQRMLDLYKEDIRTYFPDFEENAGQADTAYLISRDSEVTGIAIGKKTRDNGLSLFLDYTTPAYRDASVGRFLYPELAKNGYRNLCYEGNNPAQIIRPKLIPKSRTHL